MEANWTLYTTPKSCRLDLKSTSKTRPLALHFLTFVRCRFHKKQ